MSTRRRPNVVAGVVSNVLGEVGDQIGSLGQVLPRGGVLIDRLWDAGSQTSPSGRLLGPRCGNPSSALFLYWAVTETSPDSPNFKVLFCAPGRTRTYDRQIRRLLLYPLSYGGPTSVPSGEPYGRARASL